MKERDEIKYGIRKPVTTLTLELGQWKDLFTESKCKVMVGQALKYCIPEKPENKLFLIGYVIIKYKIHFVFKLDEQEVKEFITAFRIELEKEIHRAIDKLKEKKMSESDKEILFQADMFPKKIFERGELKNDQLIRLITGQHVDLPYYSPQLTRLKDELSRNRFCSLTDYSGAEGPVKVTRLKEYY